MSAVLTLWLAVAPAVTAQDLRGTVRDSASTQPIPGAVLLFLDSAGRTVARSLTNEHGQFHIRSSADMRRMRVLRIGFRPREATIAPSVSLLDVSMVPIPVLLEPVRVTAAARCPTLRDGAQALALLEQARAGLLATIVAREANPAALVRLGFQRRMDGISDRVVRQIVTAESVTQSTTSFEAVRTPIDFVRRGFAEDSADSRRFLAPDADALLADAFAQGYCFRVAESDRKRPNQVGLGFSAADRAPGRVDIDGRVWIDTVARALVDIEFRYEGLEDRLEARQPGGHISFRTMPNGVVLIDRWTLRLVGVEAVPGPRAWVFNAETGGVLAHATWPDGHSWHGSLGRLRLHATDARGRPAAGVDICLADTPYRGRTDVAGNLEIADLVPGPYSVVVLDPRLTERNLAFATNVQFTAVRDSTVSRSFRVPSPRDEVVQRWLVHPGSAGNAVRRLLGPC